MTEFASAGGATALPPAAPRQEHVLRGAKAAALVASLTLAVLSYQLNATMITPVLPQIATDLGESLDHVAGVSSLFFLAGGIAGIVLSRWSDFIGRKLCLMILLVILITGTLLCIVAPNLPVLLTGRVMQGCSSAAFQIAYLLLRERLQKKLFGVSLGLITAISGGAGGIDGYLGGLLAGRFGFRAVFVAILIFGLLALLSAMLHLPRDAPVDRGGRMGSRMDWAGAAALSLMLACTSFFVSDGAAIGWGSARTLAWLGGAASAFAAFWQIERRSAAPLVATHHLRSRSFWPMLMTTSLTLAGIFAVINFTIVLLSQDQRAGFGLDSATSALLYLSPAALIGVLTAPMAGWLADRLGWIRVMRLGLGASILLLIAIALRSDDPGFVMVAVALLGLTYNGLALTTLNGLGVLLSPKDAPAALPGLNGAAFGLGANLGIAIVAPFAAAGTGAGYATALCISCGITLAAFISSLFIAQEPGA
ncbi:MFS transporter [Sphingomonas oleivorans]|uniref:MFS transporter n=1 Tax=Sphingomonas oleivorans TaxID=1735121 RepID=A0A2T5FZF5_9SPHN|nr:MFS transporter [Sphingomonas oleivorans]PTQ12083.1 MFS transporter [Sphingomonas oleivorans]